MRVLYILIIEQLCKICTERDTFKVEKWTCRCFLVFLNNLRHIFGVSLLNFLVCYRLTCTGLPEMIYCISYNKILAVDIGSTLYPPNPQRGTIYHLPLSYCK